MIIYQPTDDFDPFRESDWFTQMHYDDYAPCAWCWDWVQRSSLSHDGLCWRCAAERDDFVDDDGYDPGPYLFDAPTGGFDPDDSGTTQMMVMACGPREFYPL